MKSIFPTFRKVKHTQKEIRNRRLFDVAENGEKDLTMVNPPKKLTLGLLKGIIEKSILCS